MIASGLVKYHDRLQPFLVDIDSVQPHPENYNNGDVDEVAQSIENIGMYRPVYVQQSTGFILGGNHTWEACKRLGADRIPVIPLDVDDIDAMKIMVADNEIARLALPDPPQLVSLLEQISAVDGSLSGIGKTDRDLQSLKLLMDIALDQDDFAQWPTITVRVPPHIKRAYYHVTREADDDRERFELLLRLAGWDGT